jgi:hypothetical protein
MPSNLYGVANAPGFIATGYSAVGAISCPAAAYTTVMTFNNIVAPSQGYFYPICWGSWTIGFTTTLPTDLRLGFNINGGSTVDQFQIDTALYVSNGWLQVYSVLNGTPSSTLWLAPGATINFTVNPITNLVNFRNYSSKFTVMLLRAPDQ